MALRGDIALRILDRIDNKNAKGEYYLTDAVEVAQGLGLRGRGDCARGGGPGRQRQGAARGRREGPPEPLAHGGNGVGRDADRAGDGVLQLRHADRSGHGGRAERGVRARRRDRRERNHPRIQPSRRRPRGIRRHGRPFRSPAAGSVPGPKAKVGNFVEIKNVDLGAGAKVSHLTYLGDASVGAEVNIGAGTITCNYDGYRKYRTVIGQGAFIGSNSSLVAPVTIGDGAFVGSGSVITDDAGGQSRGRRGRQAVKEGWSRDFRERSAAAKREK